MDMGVGKISDWVESEIDNVSDCYGQSRQSAVQHVRDLLDEDEYRDVLSSGEIVGAKRYMDRAYPTTPKGTHEQ